MDDLLWLGPALIAGIAAARFDLPPMVGYLLCGFVLNLSGVYDTDRLTLPMTKCGIGRPIYV